MTAPAQAELRLDRILATRSETLSFEYFPAKATAAWTAWRAVATELASLSPDFCSVTYGAGGGTRTGTRQAVEQVQRDLGCPAMAHLTCVGSSRDDLRRLFDEYHAAGIVNLLALRGDPPKGQQDWRPHPDGPRHASELLELIRTDGRFATACAAFPEGHPEAASREQDWQHLLGKFDRGACVAITQGFFSAQPYLDLRSWLTAQGRSALRIIPGVLPVQGWGWAKRFVERFSPATSLPPSLRSRLEPVDGDEATARRAGFAYTLDLCRELLKAGAPGLHIYTLNEAGFTRDLVGALRAEGWFRRD